MTAINQSNINKTGLAFLNMFEGKKVTTNDINRVKKHFAEFMTAAKNSPQSTVQR